MKQNRIWSIRFQLALYVFLSCVLTALTDMGVLVIIGFIQWNIKALGMHLPMAARIEEVIMLVLEEQEIGIRVLLIVLSILFFFGYYILLSAPMVKYLREILNGVERIKNGDLNTEVAVRSSGELRELAMAINAMQAELKVSIDKEREAEHIKDELITNVAHDLRTPLTSVIGYLNLLRQSEQLPEETSQKYIEIAYNKAERMEGLVNDLFDYTRYEKNKISMSKHPLELKQFMEQIIDEFYPSLREHQLECYTIFTPEKVYISGDGELLARAFGNLMANAIKYGADGKQIRVEVGTIPQKRQARVAITNYGQIISQKDLTKIFDKFYRVDTSRTKGEGTGLGLSIAKNIFEMHNGTIRARSSERGTVFEVLFQLE